MRVVIILGRRFLHHDNHVADAFAFDLITRPIVIEPSCWIAADAFVWPGSIVPAGTMIKANATVTAKDLQVEA